MKGANYIGAFIFFIINFAGAQILGAPSWDYFLLTGIEVLILSPICIALEIKGANK
jgi:hypothetical protein